MGDYRLAPAAVRDLEAIWQYTNEQWGADQATDYTDQLIAGFERLAQMPKMARMCDHIRTGYRRHQIARHMVYLRLTRDGIAIIRILHIRMDARQNL